MTGADLRAWRLARKLTQQDAATLFGRPFRSLAETEGNRLRIPADIEAGVRAYDEAHAIPAAVPLSQIIARANAAYADEMAPLRARIGRARARLLRLEQAQRAAAQRATARMQAMVAEARV